MYQNDVKRPVSRRKRTAHDPKHTHIKRGGRTVLAWACTAANGTGSLVFIDDMTADRSSKRILTSLGLDYLIRFSQKLFLSKY